MAWCPYRHVCGRCAGNLAVRLDFAYACAWTYTHSKAATAALTQLGTLRWELARLRGLLVWHRGRFQGSVFRLRSVYAPKGCCEHWMPYSKSWDRKTSSASEASAAPSEPLFVKAVLSLAEKLLRKLIGKVLTFVCGFR